MRHISAKTTNQVIDFEELMQSVTKELTTTSCRLRVSDEHLDLLDRIIERCNRLQIESEILWKEFIEVIFKEKAFQRERRWRKRESKVKYETVTGAAGRN